MKTLVRILGYVCVVLLLAIAGIAVYVARTWDRVWDAPIVNLKASTDPDVIRHGQYLVFGPAHCAGCHAPADAIRRPLADGETVPLSGGTRFAIRPLGIVYSRNLTPDPDTGIGRYTDGQIARMMRWAVRPDGRATLGPMMPFDGLSDADIVAILSFLRSQKPVRNEVPANEWTLVGKVVRSFASTALPRKEVHPAPTTPPQAPTRERGEYLARYVGNCIGCHTPRSMPAYLPIGPDFSGGLEFEPLPAPGADPAVWFRSPNLTPAKGSALSKFPDRETFIARFQRGGRQHEGSPMDWECLARMSTADLGALYEYFRSLPPADGPTGETTFRKSN